VKGKSGVPAPQTGSRRHAVLVIRIFALLIAAALLLLPALLLPVTTTVPAMVWLPLLVVGLAGILWMIIRRRQKAAQLAGLGTVSLVAVASQALIAPPSHRPPPR
jgi:hypothetical protein